MLQRFREETMEEKELEERRGGRERERERERERKENTLFILF
jgi:hypothetical protein